MTDPKAELEVAARASRGRRVGPVLLGIALSVGAAALLISKIDLAQLRQDIAAVDRGFLALMMLPIFGGFACLTLRSRVMFAELAQLSYWRLFLSVMAGFAANAVLPFRMGELVRTDYLARHSGRAHATCLGVIAAERVLDLVALLLLFSSVIPLSVVQIASPASLLLLAVAIPSVFAGLVAIGHRPAAFASLVGCCARPFGARLAAFVRDKASLFADALSSLRSKKVLAATFGATLAFIGCALISSSIALRSMQIDVPWYAPGIVVSFATFASVLPSAPSYVGTYHYMVALSLRPFGVSLTKSASFAVVLHAVGMLPAALVAGALLLADQAVRVRNVRGKDHG